MNSSLHMLINTITRAINIFVSSFSKFMNYFILTHNKQQVKKGNCKKERTIEKCNATLKIN